jgi:hypothetical protein
MEGWRQRRLGSKAKILGGKRKTDLTLTGLLMEGLDPRQVAKYSSNLLIIRIGGWCKSFSQWGRSLHPVYDRTVSSLDRVTNSFAVCVLDTKAILNGSLFPALSTQCPASGITET